MTQSYVCFLVGWVDGAFQEWEPYPPTTTTIAGEHYPPSVPGPQVSLTSNAAEHILQSLMERGSSTKLSRELLEGGQRSRKHGGQPGGELFLKSRQFRDLFSPKHDSALFSCSAPDRHRGSIHPEGEIWVTESEGQKEEQTRQDEYLVLI